MTIRPRTMLAALMVGGVLAVLLPTVSMGASSGNDRNGDSAVTLVEDIADPSDMQKQAEAVVGDRFVDVSVSGDHSTYVIGILGLKPGEDTDVLSQMKASAPVVLESRSVSVIALDSAREEVERAVLGNGLSYSSISENLALGRVVVAVPDEGAQSKMLDQVREVTDSSAEIVRSEDGSVSVTVAAADGTRPEIQIPIIASSVDFQEGVNESPYRAGKFVRIHYDGEFHWCTTNFFVKKNGTRFGMTAGHCGHNGDNTQFGGEPKGDIQWDQFHSTGSLVETDAELFDLGAGGTATMYRQSDLNRDVTGNFNNGDMVSGWRVCFRGAATNDQACGDLIPGLVDTTIPIGGSRSITNVYCWDWEASNVTVEGDSGAPMYRVRANESVWAAGIHSFAYDATGNNVADSSCYISINNTLNQLGATLQTN